MDVSFYLSGLRVGIDYSPLGRGKGGVTSPVPHFHEDKGCEISVNISRSGRVD